MNSKWLLALSFCALTACGTESSEPVAAEQAQTTEADIEIGQVDEISQANDRAPFHESYEAGMNEVVRPGEALPQALDMVESWTGDLDAMVERRIIRVLSVYGPGRYFLDNGPRGIAVDYAAKLQKAVNKAYETGLLKAHVVIIPVARNQLFDALNAGRGDIVIAGTTITDARDKKVDFTTPVSKPLEEILITGPSAPKIKTLADLSGKSIHVRMSSSYAESLQTLSDKLVAEGKEPINIEPISELLEDEDLIEMVNTGLLPWAVVDDYKPLMWKGVFDKITIWDDLVLRKGGRQAWAIRENSPQLKKFLNTFLAENKEGTLFGNILKNRYVRDFDWTSNALGMEELARYRKMKQIFVSQGQNYGIDPALLAAQGYQESRLDQSARSHAGAIGVMQLLKSTAKDKNVGIPNIEELEPNIEAGAKYLSFVKNRYFSDEGVDSLNGALFSLASYNAGPARVRKLRAKAKARGYDHTVWFDNVEVIAAEDIGRETVQYVSNIYKYYLTYQMINRQAVLKDAAKASLGVSE